MNLLLLRVNQSDVFKLTVKPEEIWTPSIDVANRIHDYSPTTERFMMSTVDYQGTIFIMLTSFQFQQFQVLSVSIDFSGFT